MLLERSTWPAPHNILTDCYKPESELLQVNVKAVLLACNLYCIDLGFGLEGLSLCAEGC